MLRLACKIILYEVKYYTILTQIRTHMLHYCMYTSTLMNENKLYNLLTHHSS
jgi:hypothetical protein